MSSELLIQNVRPLGGAATDLLVRNGLIEQMEPGLKPSGAVPVLDGQGQLLLPGLVNAHAHIDKNLFGLPWQRNQVPGLRIRDFVDNERQVRRDLNLNTRV